MTDLTKILKVGDRLWDSRYGEVVVTDVIHSSQSYPILASALSRLNPFCLAFTKEGRLAENTEITLYPLDQKPAPPQWPEVPETFKWEGEIYTKGEWVAVRAYSTQSFTIVQLATINDSQYPIKCSDNWVYSEMRKLRSFNQPEEKE